MNRYVVLYHYPCMDGFTAACLLVYYKLAWETGSDFVCIPWSYRDGIPDEVDGAHVYILDCCPDDVGAMQEIAERAASLTWYDHHDSKRPVYEAIKDHPKITCIFDTSRSGAMITFDALEADFLTRKETAELIADPLSAWHSVRRLVEYVQDRDLWRFDLEHSDEISQALRLWWGPRQRDVPESAQEFLRTNPFDLVPLGTILVAKREKEIERFLRVGYEPQDERFAGWMVSNATTDYTSEIGHRLAVASRVSVGCVFWYTGPEKGWHYELRSTDDGPHVGEIAHDLGGGGHPNAAGFFHPTNLFAEAATA